MTLDTTPNDLTNFEAAPIRDGARVEFVMRRKGGPAILARLPQHSRQAVETYTATAEAVMAGGASVPTDHLTGGCTSGAPAREGRQAKAMDQVRFLRKMESAVGAGVVQVGLRNPLEVPLIDLWRAVCLGDVAMEAFLKRRGLKPAKSRIAALNQAFTETAERVSDAIGQTKSPF